MRQSTEPNGILWLLAVVLCALVLLILASGCGFVSYGEFTEGTLFKDASVSRVVIIKPDGTRYEIEGVNSRTNNEALGAVGTAMFEAGVRAAMKAGAGGSVGGGSGVAGR